MKVYISGDIEGITGTTHWNETEKNLPDWGLYQLDSILRNILKF